MANLRKSKGLREIIKVGIYHFFLVYIPLEKTVRPSVGNFHGDSGGSADLSFSVDGGVSVALAEPRSHADNLFAWC